MFDGIKKWWYGPDEKVQNVSEELDVYNEDDDGYYDVGKEKTNTNNKINYVVSDEIKRDIVKGFYLNKVEIKNNIKNGNFSILPNNNFLNISVNSSTFSIL